MPRPRNPRRIAFSPSATFFKPRGIPLGALEIVELAREELEALRLSDLEQLTQEESAKRMQTSQSTFQRLLAAARAKTADALTNGKAITIAEPPL